MLDFMEVGKRITKSGITEIYPRFIAKRSKDLLCRGGDFYAIWIEDKGIWSTDEQDARDLIDRELDRYVNEHKDQLFNYQVLYIRYTENTMIDKWLRYVQKQTRPSKVTLDEKLIFLDDPVNKEDYASKRLNYPLVNCPIPNYDKLMSTLYSPEERRKIEWAIGAIVTGDSKRIQKFLVLYGSAGTGKSTVLNIIQQLFEGYYASFDAKSLGAANSAFALEPFASNPLVAIQHDGDLSRIEDNTRLNSIVSHEDLIVNEKFKSTYAARFNAFLFMGTNKPVKITDAKSGLIRRLIDVSPSGDKLPVRTYNHCMKQIPFELGGIATHCRDLYLEDPHYYDSYMPLSMMSASNDFYNYVIDSYSVFKEEDGVSLKVAWEMYKQYCDDTNVMYGRMSRMVFKEELKNYFHVYEDRKLTDDGSRIRSYYSGFRVEKFNPEEAPKEKEPEPKTLGWLDMIEQESIFDRELADCPAQYASVKETPKKAWDNVTTKLTSIDTHKLHYVKVPENHIVIDFDLKDADGNKSFQRNLDAASSWPPTYAEVSKGGAGIHLHYLYLGDVTKLSRIFDDEIEIKVFTGKSSLRRRLSICNAYPIASLSSGLPLRGEKMVNHESFTTERGLRTTIKRCIAKEIHVGTKPNVDFIFKILEDAYNSDLKYDVSDMLNAVLEFAAGSTHQAQYCLELVSKMHFASEEPSIPDKSDGAFVFYDIEVFPNLFLVNWKMQGKGNPVYRMINPTPKMIEDLVKFNLIGFNCRRYDNHLIYARMIGYDNQALYELSQKIISGDKNAFFREAYNLSYTDVYDFASASNKKSLKKLEIEMGIHHKELGLPWDKPVPEDRWEEVALYCDNDVIATEAAFEYLSADWTARQILADLAEMSVNDTTNSLSTKIIFGNNRKPQSAFQYRNMAEPVTSLDKDVIGFLRMACPDMMNIFHGDAKSILPYFPGYKFEKGVSTYRGEKVGEGGYVYAEPGAYSHVALLDVASMHPHSAIAECLFGVKYTTAFRDIVEGRVSIKHEAWDEVNKMLDGKLTKHIQRVINGEMSSGQLANALKTAINSVYGLTSASFDNPFNDRRNVDNIVAKRGALFMIDLKHEVQKRGFTVAHIKTDSIKIPNATPDIIKFVMDFGKRYGYTFEHEATYDKMCLVNDSVYVCKYLDHESCKKIYGYVPDKNNKKAGKWDATGTQFAVPYLFKSMFSKEPIEFKDKCMTFASNSGDIYMDMNEDKPDVSGLEKELEKVRKKIAKESTDELVRHEQALLNAIPDGHNYIFVGKIGSFVPVKPGMHGGNLYRYQNNKYYSVGGSKGYRWMETETVLNAFGENTDIVDTGYFVDLINEAHDAISQYTDYDWFVSDDQAPLPTSSYDYSQEEDIDLPF